MTALHPSPDPYYQFSAHEVAARGRTYTFFTRPALGQWRESLTSALLLAGRLPVHGSAPNMPISREQDAGSMPWRSISSTMFST